MNKTKDLTLSIKQIENYFNIDVKNININIY